MTKRTRKGKFISAEEVRPLYSDLEQFLSKLEKMGLCMSYVDSEETRWYALKPSTLDQL